MRTERRWRVTRPGVKKQKGGSRESGLKMVEEESFV